MNKSQACSPNLLLLICFSLLMICTQNLRGVTKIKYNPKSTEITIQVPAGKLIKLKLLGPLYQTISYELFLEQSLTKLQTKSNLNCSIACPIKELNPQIKTIYRLAINHPFPYSKDSRYVQVYDLNYISQSVMTLGGGYFTIDFKYAVSNGVIAYNFVNKNFSMYVYAAGLIFLLFFYFIVFWLIFDIDTLYQYDKKGKDKSKNQNVHRLEQKIQQDGLFNSELRDRILKKIREEKRIEKE